MVIFKEIINPMIATSHTIAKSVYFSLVYFQKRDLSPTPKPIKSLAFL